MFDYLIIAIGAFGVIFSAFLAVFLLYGAYSVIAGAPFVPSKDYRIKNLLDLAEIKNGDCVYDLGSGDARVMIAAALRGAGQIHGFEINPFVNWMGRIRIWRQGLQGRAHLHLKNLFKVNCEGADVVIIYLFPRAMVRLEDQLRRTARKGTRIVVGGFPFPNWQPIRTIGHAYLYVA